MCELFLCTQGVQLMHLKVLKFRDDPSVSLAAVVEKREGALNSPYPSQARVMSNNVFSRWLIMGEVNN